MDTYQILKLLLDIISSFFRQNFNVYSRSSKEYNDHSSLRKTCLRDGSSNPFIYPGTMGWDMEVTKNIKN